MRGLPVGAAAGSYVLRDGEVELIEEMELGDRRAVPLRLDGEPVALSAIRPRAGSRAR